LGLRVGRQAFFSAGSLPHHDRERRRQLQLQLYGIGSNAGNANIAIPLSQSSKAFLVEPKMRIWRHWYAGPRYHIISNSIQLNSDRVPDGSASASTLPVELPTKDLNLRTAALGLRLQRDSTISPFYPRSGSLLDFTADFFAPALGAQRNYRQFNLIYNKYIGFGKKNVLAAHGIVCSASSDAPFFDVCLLGNARDLRGYQAGQYRDHRMLAAQVEYRRELFWRLGATAFVGTGAASKMFSDLQASDWIPGTGLGLRLELAKRNHINLRADYAWGENSHAFYVGVGEAF
jgi:outer membrane translocation and assembly module TamA